MAFGDIKGTFSGNAASITNPFDAATLISGSGAVVVGDLIYAVCNQQTALTVTACTDNLGNTYTATNAGVDSGTSTGRAFYSRVTVAGTITFVRFTTTASANNVTACAVLFEGPFKAPPIDTNPANASDAASPFTGPATGTLAQAEELVVAWGAAAGAAVWTATSPNVKRVEVASAALVKSVIGSQVVAATTSVQPVWTGTNPTDNTLGTTSFAQDLSQPLTPSLFVDGDTFFAPSVNLVLLPSLFTNTTVFGPGSDDTFWGVDVEQVAGGTQDLAPALYVDADTFFAPTVTAGAITLLPALYVDADTFFSPTVTVGAVTLLPNLYTDADTFFSPTVTRGAVTLLPNLYTDADTFFAPTVTATYTLLPNLYTDADTFFSPTVTAGAVTLLPNLYTDADTFFSPTVTVGAVTLTPNLYVDADTFFSPTISTAAGQLFVDLFVNTNTFFSATVTAGAVSLLPNLYVDADTFFAPTVSQFTEIAPALFTNTNVFFTPTVTGGAVTLLPDLYVDADTFGAPTVATEFMLLANLYVDADTFFAHDVTADPTQHLVSDAFANVNVFFTPLVEGGAARRIDRSNPIGGRTRTTVEPRSNVQANNMRSNSQNTSIRRPAA